MKKILVVGRGIAGTVLAHSLEKRGAQVQIAGASQLGQASSVAAGVINPVTGKRFALSWRFGEFYPYAKNFYKDLEATTGQRLWHEMPILRLLSTVKEENDWSSRLALPDYAPYLYENQTGGTWTGLLQSGFRYGVLHCAGRVDFEAILSFFKKKWQTENKLLPRNIPPEAAEKLAPEYDHIIFCEGFAAANNPFFSDNAVWKLAKGEALLLKIRDPRAEKISEMLKKKIMIVPIGRSIFWAGANYQWDFEDAAPSDLGKNFILEELQSMLAVPIEVQSHLAGIRPATADRRPRVYLHEQFSKFGIFNGFGSKGALMIPFFAQSFAEQLLRD